MAYNPYAQNIINIPYNQNIIHNPYNQNVINLPNNQNIINIPYSQNMKQTPLISQTISQSYNVSVSVEEAKQFLIKGCNISPSILDDKGTTNTGWRIGAKSGPPGYLKDFIPPIG